MKDDFIGVVGEQTPTTAVNFNGAVGEQTPTAAANVVGERTPTTAAAADSVYTIPARFRKTENLHIVFWLIKDMSWAMLWKPLGIMMIAPTMFVALLITWQTRKIKSELYHNVAVTCWITANAFWMITEFWNRDDLRFYTIIPFASGLISIGYYYLRKLGSRNKKA